MQAPPANSAAKKNAPSNSSASARPTSRARKIRHTRARKIRHTRARKIRHTRARRGYLAEPSTQAPPQPPPYPRSHDPPYPRKKDPSYPRSPRVSRRAQHPSRFRVATPPLHARAPTVIPAPLSVIPAPLFVIPAQAGTTRPPAPVRAAMPRRSTNPLRAYCLPTSARITEVQTPPKAGASPARDLGRGCPSRQSCRRS